MNTNNQNDLTLLVLAAGMGSRFGGLKQMEGVGPNNETILDYSIFDAISAGFTKVVFIIRKSFEQEFKSIYTEARYNNRIALDFIYQELDSMLPDGYTLPEERVKPWGTNHAVLMALGVIETPFAVINADDFYGKETYKVAADYLNTLRNSTGKYCMVGYQIEKTLSDYGTVARGVCEVDSDNYLTSIVERTSVKREPDGKIYYQNNGGRDTIPDGATVSMNFFGFTPDYLELSKKGFEQFLKEKGEDPKGEFYIPLMVNNLVSSGQARVKVLRTSSQWFGVTYANDKPTVQQKILELIASGEYPEKIIES